MFPNLRPLLGPDALVARGKPVIGIIAAVAVLSSLIVVFASKAAYSTTYVSMYSTSTRPSDDSEEDSSAVELGTQFTVSRPGRIVGARFYKSEDNTGTHTATLWSSSGDVLTTGTFDDETDSGWQTLIFDRPVVVVAGGDYVISYHTNTGYYAQDKWRFSDDATIGNSTIRGTAGVYHYGSRSGFPTQTWAAAAYYVDTLFDPNGSNSEPTEPSDTPKPSSKPTSAAPTAPTRAPSSSDAPQSTGNANPAPPTTPVASKTPTSTPTRTTTPPASSGSWPGPDNTGVPAGTSLTARSGDLTVTTPGTVIDGIDLNGCLNVRAANVTIKNSRIRGGCTYVVGSYSSGLTIQDSEVDGLNSSGAAVGIGYAGFTAIRVDVHGSQDGINANGNVLIQDSWVHDLHEANSSHNDGIQITEGSNITIRHNTVENSMDETSAVMIGADQGDVSNVLVEQNLLAGGGWALYGGAEPPGGNSISNITLRNNAFSTRFFPGCGSAGPITATNDSEISSTGEYWLETGKPLG